MKKVILFVCLALVSIGISAQDYSNVNYITKHGKLKLVDNQLCDQQGNPVQLKGWSTFGLQWNQSCYTKSSFRQMKAWGANVVRLAMYVYEGGASSDMDGYITKMKNYIDWANEIGLYCIVDWHVLTPGAPNKYLNSELKGRGAEYFFDAVSAYVKQKGYVHVIYEICNEPNDCTWSDIKTYANKILPHISQSSPFSVVIIGTPDWCQSIDEAANDPISYSSLYLMYSFHYSACSHANLLSKLKSAAGKIPCFVSQWQTISSDDNATKDSEGEYIICEKNSDLLMAVCDGDNAGLKKFSWCMWFWGDQDWGAATCKSCGNISETNLRSSGRYILPKLCGDDDCRTIIKTDGPYNGTPQKIPNDLFQLAYYDLGGEGVAYHDENSTAFEYFGLPENADKTEVVIDGTTYKRSNVCRTDDNGNICHCNAGYKYASKGWKFRPDDAVDVCSSYGVAGDWKSYYLELFEAGEWLVYTVDVEEPGYYQVEYQGSKDTEGQVEFTVKKEGVSYGNAVYNYRNETEFTGRLTLDKMTDCHEPGDWLCWEWLEFWTKGDKYPAVLFKEAGLLQLVISFPVGGNGLSLLGPLRFKKKKDYNGPRYDGSPQNSGLKEAKAGKVQGKKYVRDGVLYIDVNGKTYNAQGAQVR